MFGLSLLPGTAMRATAKEDGVVFDAAPPYRVRRTATLDGDALAELLAEAEDRLDRSLEEDPRPHLVDGAGDDATRIEEPARPAARHVALWARGEDLFDRRAELARAIDARLAMDPHGTLDVVLEARREFPLDLVDLRPGAARRWRAHLPEDRASGGDRRARGRGGFT